MNEKTKEAIKRYQCSGCVSGNDMVCYKESKRDNGIQCANHVAGTVISYIGLIFLGLPVGFCRLGEDEKIKISIFETFEDGWGYDKFNVPVWKYLDDHGNTLIRGMCPRINQPWIHIFIGDHISKIYCLEITQKDIDEMD